MSKKYIPINETQKIHIKNLINWLIAEVISAGGDGDALWYSRSYSVDEIFSILKECDLYDFTIDKQDNRITFGTGQEWLVITNDERDGMNAPSWQQVRICY